MDRSNMDFHTLLVLCEERMAVERRWMAQIDLVFDSGDRDWAREMLKGWTAYHEVSKALLETGRPAYNRSRAREQVIEPPGEQTVH